MSRSTTCRTTRGSLFIHNVAVVGVHPQAARLHLLQTGAAERTGLGFGVPAVRANELCYGPPPR
jgi:hypothetical protein